MESVLQLERPWPEIRIVERESELLYIGTVIPYFINPSHTTEFPGKHVNKITIAKWARLPRPRSHQRGQALLVHHSDLHPVCSILNELASTLHQHPADAITTA